MHCKKQQHRSRVGACAQALSLVRTKGADMANLTIYHCPCGCYHVARKRRK